jgi:C-terminal processing protease CtpA/Prc
VCVLFVGWLVDLTYWLVGQANQPTKQTTTNPPLKKHAHPQNTHNNTQTHPHTYTHNTPKQPKQATAQLRSVLYAEERVGASGYVLDLRNNMGGIFQEALKMAALFLPDPKVFCGCV